MHRAVELAATVRSVTSPNPWVGCVLVCRDGTTVEGATGPPGDLHAEAAALAAAGASAEGATAYVTLEPCSHHGRTPPCADAILDAGIERVVVGIEDPDPKVAGQGVERLRQAGVDVEVGLLAEAIEDQLRPYLVHRRTGRPYVVLKLAATLDGRTAAPDGTSRWITGELARVDAHRLRAESDAVIVGAGTVRADDPELTVRHVPSPRGDPLRVVLGAVPEGARVHPCIERTGDLGAILDELGEKDCIQVLVEGGARVASEFHRARLVDRYVLYLAPALTGGDDAPGLFQGAGVPTIDELWRGTLRSVQRLGDDLRVELDPLPRREEA